jgi:hypothetical protein
MAPPPLFGAALSTTPPTGAGYDVVLLAHVGCAVAGFATVVASGVQAARLRSVQPGELPAPSLLRYFAPGTNWAGRLLYGVPVFGFVLIGLSKGAFDANDPFIVAGLLIWVVSAVAAEVGLWPTERRVQAVLAEAGPLPAQGAAAGRTDPVALGEALERARPLCRVIAVLAVALTLLFVVATVLMFAQP